jgi:hypothetical protein
MPKNWDIKTDASGIPQEPSWMVGHIRLTEKQWGQLAHLIKTNERELTRKRKLFNAKAFIADKAKGVRGITRAMVMNDNVFKNACELAGVTKEFVR